MFCLFRILNRRIKKNCSPIFLLINVLLRIRLKDLIGLVSFILFCLIIYHANTYLKKIKSADDLLILLNKYRKLKEKSSINIIDPFNSSKLTNLYQTKDKSLKLKMEDALFNKVMVNSESVKFNFYEPEFLIPNEHLCKNKKNLFMLFVIHSHRNNFIRRQALRDTWLSQQKIDLFKLIIETENFQINFDYFNGRKLDIAHVFIIATEKNINKSKIIIDNQIEIESKLFNDLVVIDMIDSYQNLLYKHLSIVKWVTKYCSNSVFVIKLDDDVFINLKLLTKDLVTQISLGQVDLERKFIYCNFIDDALVKRNKESKHRVDYQTYPFEYYPRYCEGFAYITNPSTFGLIYEQSHIIPRYWIDDVYG